MTSSDDQHDEQSNDDADSSETTPSEDGSETPVATYTILSIIAVILIGYGLTTWLTGAEQPDAYNGFEFTRTGQGFYETRVSGAAGETALQFREHPSDVDNISMSSRVPLAMRAMQERNGSLVLTVDDAYAEGGRSGIALYEISKITNYMFGINTTGAVMNASLSDRYPEITCANVTSERVVIEITEGEETAITEENGCITMTAPTGADVIRGADRIVYGLLGIIE